MPERGRDDDRVERAAFRPAVIAIGDLSLHVAVSLRRQVFGRGLAELGDDLDRADLPDERRQHRRLVARTGPNLEHHVVRLGLEEVGHQRHDEGLRDGLAVADLDRTVVISH